MSSVIHWIFGSERRATNALPSDAWHVALSAIVLIDALVICLAYALYAAGSFGLLASPIFDLAEPFL